MYLSGPSKGGRPESVRVVGDESWMLHEGNRPAVAILRDFHKGILNFWLFSLSEYFSLHTALHCIALIPLHAVN